MSSGVVPIGEAGSPKIFEVSAAITAMQDEPAAMDQSGDVILIDVAVLQIVGTRIVRAPARFPKRSCSIEDLEHDGDSTKPIAL